ncbi:extracellular solute-binding protein [Kineococcus sp. SYSU DK018]|uniref:extracellular solute-binding protein n=1 Tax=Kineococcus sp. SYSU DK018 TaxID=3383139 RepID=UPI003D7DE3AF
MNINGDFALPRRGVLALALSATALGATACAPGSSGSEAAPTSSQPVTTDAASLGEVTLTVWDQNTEGGINDAQNALNEQFMAAYPNIKIERVTRSFSDLKTTLKLALSGEDAPDVVQANQGYPDMGAFVEAGLLQPLDPWADVYGWSERYPEDLLSLNKFSADGATWRDGNLYGVSQTGEIVGVYYNKEQLAQAGLSAPVTFEDFEAALPVLQAAGLQPMQYGDSDKSPGIHLYGATLSALAGEDAASDLVSAAGGAWTDEAPLQAATKLAEWSTKGYLPEGHNGVSKDQAVTDFAQGKGTFLIQGTWQQATLEEAMGDNVGFAALSGVSGKPETLGGVGLAWAITSKATNANAAAVYIEFITNAAASQVLVETGNLPVILPEEYEAAAGTLAGDIASQWVEVSQQGGLVPYLDYATPTFYDTLTAGVQQLTGGQRTPEQFTESLQQDYSAFLEDR